MNLPSHLEIRSLQAADRDALSVLIREMGAAFSATEVGQGNPESEANRLCETYLSFEKPAYWLLCNHQTGQVLAGAGLVSRKGLNQQAGVGELRDLLLHPSLYGSGEVQALAQYALDQALVRGYKLIYLETLTQSLFNQDSGLRFLRSGRTVRYTHLSPE
jgi:hypothetical protein